MPETTDSDFVLVVGPNDEPLGAVPKRELRLMPGLHFRTSHAFVFDPQGRLLLQQLAPERDRNALKWGSSIAAYVRPRETYHDAVARRSLEELGIEVKLEEVGTTEMPDLRGVKHIALFVGRVRHRIVDIREPDHVAGISWLPLEVVATLIDRRPAMFTETFLWLFREFYADGGLGTARSA